MAKLEALRQVVSYTSKVKVIVGFDEPMMGVTAKEYFEKYRENGETAKSDIESINYANSKTEEISSALDIPKMLYIPVEFSKFDRKAMLLGFDAISVEENDTVTIDDTYLDEDIVTITIMKGGEQ